MLYRQTSPDEFAPWAGEEIDGARHPLSIEQQWSASELAAIDLYLPADADPVPEGKVAVATDVRRVDGVVKFVHTLEDAPFEALRAAKIEAVNARRDAVLTGGYTVQAGDMAGKVLQTRDLEDRTNWLISQGSYSAAVAGGHGAVVGARFRTADNETFTLSYADGLAVLLAMAAWGAAVMDNSWALKDAALAAEDAAALDGVDVEAGWP